MGMGNIATTGMKAAMTNMEVISNNIANSNTYGYKGSYTNFADIYPAGASNQAGLGVSVSSITQSFSPGGSAPTGNPSDLYIKNQGFFVMRDATSGITSYSRYGKFSLDSEGFFSIGNQRAQGFGANNGVIPSGVAPTDLFINTSPIPAKASTSITQNDLNLQASANTPTVTPFDINVTSSYNFKTETSIYDSLGNTNNVSLYYVKTAANEWTVNAYVDNASVGTGSLTFTTTGALDTVTGLDSLSFNPTSGATSPQVFSVDMLGATQFANPYNANAFSTDGFAAGTYSGYSIDGNGEVSANYSNRQTVLAGKIAIATFQSPQGLQNMGNMSWTSTIASGEANVNQNNSQDAFKTGMLEMSNVDLATEMVNLISAQNIFQANAQVQQAYNQVMQTVTKL